MTDAVTATYDVDPGFVAEPRSSVHTFVLNGELVLYEERNGTLHHLNPQAGLIWRCLDGSGPLTDLVDDLSEAYRVEAAAIEHDVLGLVGQLAANGLLRGIGPEFQPDADDEPAPSPRFLLEPPAP